MSMNKKSSKRDAQNGRPAAGAKPSQEAMDKLVGLYNSGQLSAAEIEARRLIEQHKRMPELYNMLGMILTGQSKLDEAVDCYRQVLKFKPDAVGAFINLGNVYQRLNKLEEAVASFEQALKIKPDIAQVHNNLGAALASQGKFAEAVDSYRRALKIQPDYVQAHNNLGNALRDLGQLAEAKASFEQALKIKPDNAETFYNLHTLLLDKEDMSSAVTSLENAVKLQPANANYRLNLGMLLEYSGDTAGAEPHLKEVAHGSALDRARLDAWQYIKSAAPAMPTMIGSYLEAFRLGVHAARAAGLVLEFGVRFGTTIRQIAGLVEQQVHGFDSFEGLPEAWHHEQKGSYTTKGVMPRVPDNVQLHKGWFEDTLPEFVKTHKEPVRFMNIDCDLYSATKTILDTLAAQIVPGTVIVFDEYIGNEHWRKDEYKAFQEAVSAYGWRYEYLAFSLFTKQVVVRIL
jgi:tetratricopeptide (TPR) repeat protein